MNCVCNIEHILGDLDQHFFYLSNLFLTLDKFQFQKICILILKYVMLAKNKILVFTCGYLCKHHFLMDAKVKQKMHILCTLSFHEDRIVILPSYYQISSTEI